MAKTGGHACKQQVLRVQAAAEMRGPMTQRVRRKFTAGHVICGTRVQCIPCKCRQVLAKGKERMRCAVAASLHHVWTHRVHLEG